MKAVQFWNSVIGTLFIVIGLAILAAVTYLLYKPEGSDVSAAPPSRVGESAVFSCPGMTIVSLYEEGGVQLSLADGNNIRMTKVGAAFRADFGVRYESIDRSFAFEDLDRTAYFEQDGRVVFGECTRQN